MILLIFIVCLFVVQMFLGYKEGFAKVAFSLVAWLIGIIAAYMLTPVVANEITTKTELATTIETAIYEQITNAVGELNMEGFVSLPYAVQDILLGDYESVDALIQNGAVQALDIAGMTNSIINILALIIVLLGIRVVFVIVEKLMGGVSKLPLIGLANKLLGVAAGVARALMWSWVILALISVVTFTGYNSTLMAQVSESAFLTWLYENNVILNIMNSSL